MSMGSSDCQKRKAVLLKTSFTFVTKQEVLAKPLKAVHFELSHSTMAEYKSLPPALKNQNLG